MKKLTPKEKKVFDFIVSFKDRYKHTPLLSEIQRGLRISKSLAQYYVNNLEKKGFIKKVLNKRIIRLIQ